jgi:hypothetical protein
MQSLARTTAPKSKASGELGGRRKVGDRAAGLVSASSFAYHQQPTAGVDVLRFQVDVDR